MKAYVILQRGFEYNDEIYSSQDSGCGFPKKIFYTKEGAKEEVLRLNINEMKSSNITDYAYDVEDICDDVEELTNFCKKMLETYGPVPTSDNIWDRADEYRLHPSATDEDSKKYMKIVDLDFFEIVETEIDQQDLIDSRIKSII
jgi:hypothetical protein